MEPNAHYEDSIFDNVSENRKFAVFLDSFITVIEPHYDILTNITPENYILESDGHKESLSFSISQEEFQNKLASIFKDFGIYEAILELAQHDDEDHS